MPNRTVVITGASDGIGAAAARALARAGEQVVVVGRSPDKTAAVAREIGAPHYLADYTKLDEVRDLAAALATAYPRIDVLANNAGGVMGDRVVTGDGFEKTFQVNHLGGFLLTAELMPVLVSSGASVINTSSVAARAFSRFDLGDLQGEQRYAAMSAYGNGKLANVLHARELQRRYGPGSQGAAALGGPGVNAASFHPGVIASNFASEGGFLTRLMYRPPFKYFMAGPDAGADTLVWLATARPGTDWPSAEFFDKRRVSRTHDLGYDDVLAGKFWDESARLAGTTLPV